MKYEQPSTNVAENAGLQSTFLQIPKLHIAFRIDDVLLHTNRIFWTLTVVNHIIGTRANVIPVRKFKILKKHLCSINFRLHLVRHHC